MRKKKVRLSQAIVILITAMLVGIVALDLVLIYDIAGEQVEEIGRMRIQNIASGFQKSLTRAENTFDRVSSDFEELLLGGATEEEIRLFLSQQRAMEYTLSEGLCLNVFCAVDGLVMISDMDTPEDYVLQERSWYRALMTRKKGEIYISPAYEDAWTDNMCFTMAKMLDDGAAVVGIDYSVSEIQSYVAEMSGDGYGDAMIVDENEMIVGYTDPDMIGRTLSAALPGYRDAFLRAVAADADNFVLHNGMGAQSDTIFCSRTENGWYMMCSVSNWDLYRESYFQLLRNSVVLVLFALAIVVFYFRGQKSGRKNDVDEIPVKKRHIRITEEEQRKFQYGITSIFVFTMIIVIAYAANMTINESRIKMEEELWEFHDMVGKWAVEQRSILYMFDNVVAAMPELLDDYEGMVEFLNDITEHYPRISSAYIGNPDFAHGHPLVMDNGWVPGENFVVEQRPWYIGALTSQGFNITEPYYDARTGGYCITFSKVVESDKGEFYGVFGMDFYLNVLMDILDQSYTELGYAFLVDKNGLVVDHPNPEYHLSNEGSVNVHDLIYDRLYGQSDMVLLRDYDGEYKVCAAMDEPVSDFRIIVVKDWWEIYGSAIKYSALFLALFGGCILAVNWVISKMIHWQRNANEELKKAADSAIQGEKAKALFLSNMSHEIRTPLNAILGMNEMVLRECTDSQLLTYSGNIQSSGRTLLTLINDILDMSKIESGKMEIIPTEYKTADLFIDLWNVIYLRAENKSLTVSFAVDETLPDTLYGDDVRVKQVITNILTNAVKYTNQGGVELRAAYERQGEDRITLIVSVQDTGIGIKEEDLGKLFENFQRLDENKNRNIEGTGLGMSITSMLLKLMDGDIEVQSVYQEGSTFTVRIPQKVISNEPLGDFESIRNHHTLTNAGYNGRYEAPEANILVVDDNPLNLVVFTSFLKLTNMNIVTAESGEKCLELVREQPFHIIFMDHMMPKMDGVEALHEIQKMKGSPNEKTPVVALTANAISGAREYYLKEGFTDFLTKPIESDKLDQMVITYLPEELVYYKKEIEVEESAEGSDATQESGVGDYSRHQGNNVARENSIKDHSGCQGNSAAGENSIKDHSGHQGNSAARENSIEDHSRYQEENVVGTSGAGNHSQYQESSVAGESGAGNVGRNQESGASGESVVGKSGQNQENGASKVRGAREYGRYQEYGIFIEKGLTNMAGSKELYLNIVEMFVNDTEKLDLLKQFKADQDAQNYGIKVHALKGDARTLGADSLADVAYEHEKQSKAGNLAYVEEHWDELVEQWDRARAGFEEFCRENGRGPVQAPVPADSATPDTAGGVGSRTVKVTQEEIEEVISLLDDYETFKAAAKMREWLQNSLEPEQRMLIENALTAIEREYDEDKAIEILKNCAL